MAYIDEIAKTQEKVIAVWSLAASGDTKDAENFFGELELSPGRERWFNLPDRPPDAVSVSCFKVNWWQLEDGTVLGLEEGGLPRRWIIPPGLAVPEVQDFRPIEVEIQASRVPREIRHRLAEEVENLYDDITRGCEVDDLRPFVLCGLEIGYRMARGEKVDIPGAVMECAARAQYPKDSPVVTYDEPPMISKAV